MSRLGKRLARLAQRVDSDAAAAVDIRTLRERLAAQLGEPPPRAAVPPQRLELDALHSDHGTIHRRRAVYAPAERVGAYAVGSAASACATTLSLLALTPELASCRPGRAIFLDTETTGFGNGTGNVAFLVGLSWFDEPSGDLIVEQLFMRSPSEELAMLERLRARLQWGDCVVTHNGKSFDWSVLRGRCVMNRLPPLPERPQLDLLHLARRVHRHRSWSKRLGRLEVELLGFRRGGDIDGEEVAQRYLHFLRTQDESGLEDVMRHNLLDVLSLAALTGLYGEPLELPAIEIAAIARVVRRAGDLERAVELADLAVARGAGAQGLRARAEIAKARGDKCQALRDFEALADQVSDPEVRLELAKLYEHFSKQPGRALSMVELGTSEQRDAREHRRARLARKVARSLE